MSATEIEQPQIDGFRIKSEIYRNGNGVIYKGAREEDNLPVIIKVASAELNPRSAARLRNEYEIRKGLNGIGPGIVKAHDLKEVGNTTALILEDFGGVSLNKILARGRLEIKQFLEIGVELCKALAKIHAGRVIHKDIKPSNIIVNLNTREIKFSDFGISAVFKKGDSDEENRTVMEGTLAYIAPEQTGRMEARVDFRSDLYSLGIVFYELLSGSPPFISQDPMVLVHSHMAVMPEPVQNLNAEIPYTLSKIIQKLLSKIPEERYQTARGLRTDLILCLRHIRKTGTIPNFIPGQNDVSENFEISTNIFGRNQETVILMTAFGQVTHGESNLLLISGYSGIGKSSLVSKIQQPIIENHAYFIRGKFDQYKKDIPCSALLQAFEELIRKILIESETSIRKHKKELLDQLEDNAQVIIDVLPELKQLLGEQPSVPHLSPAETSNRFNLVFKNFIGVFARQEHPLVIFLDDLQWADTTSLNLMEFLLTDLDIGYLLFIGAFRANEVEESHPLHITIDEIKKSDTEVHRVDLGPLNKDAINSIVADTLKLEPAYTRSLSEIIYTRTDGNPFFTGQLLKTLYEETILSFNPSRGRWEWDFDKIENLNVAENVVELMSAKIKKLTEKSQHILKLASGIGTQFELKTLSIVNEKMMGETAQDLFESVSEGLLIPMGEKYKYAVHDKPAPGSSATQEDDAYIEFATQYRFSHDRVQQAAYSLIPVENREELHYTIGIHLLENTKEKRLDENINDIVNHLNLSPGRFDTEEKRIQLAKLNLQAGKKAKRATAFAPASNYFSFAIDLLPENAWEEYYELTLDLYNQRAETEQLLSNLDLSDRLVKQIISHATNPLDMVTAYEARIRSCNARNSLRDAIVAGREILKKLGVSLPRFATYSHVVIELLKTKVLIKRLGAESILEKSPAEDPSIIAANRILMSVASSAYQSNFNIFALIIFNLTSLSYRHGLTTVSPYALGLYSVAHAGVLEDFDGAMLYGKLSLDLLERPGTEEVKSKTFFLYEAFVRHWRRPLARTLKRLKSAAQEGVSAGDLEYYGYNLFFYCLHSIFSVGKLTDLEKEITKYHSILEKYHQFQPLYILKIWGQFVQNLLGRSENQLVLTGELFQEEEGLEFINQTNYLSAIAYFHLAKAILYFLFGKYEEAYRHIRKAKTREQSLVAMAVVPQLYFYESLIIFELSRRKPDQKNNNRLRNARKVKSNISRMRKWAKNAPENYAHKLALLEAEYLRATHKYGDAIPFYEKAILGARESKIMLDEGIANDLTAQFYLEAGNNQFARIYTQQAIRSHRRWGSSPRVQELQTRLENMKLAAETEENEGEEEKKVTRVRRVRDSDTENTYGDRDSTMGPTTGNTDNIGMLDMGAMIKASQAISGEIKLESLLSQLMTILIENAGAERGVLVLNKNENFYVEVEGRAGEINFNRVELEDAEHIIPLAMVNLAIRTKENVILADATRESRFAGDNYVIRVRPRSVLCAPVVNQGKLSGLIYLENNLAQGVFTAERIQILNLLSSQVAISLENSLLYSEMEKNVKERTQELIETLEEVRNLKKAQDGDYYLTTLITNPLFKNLNRSEYVTTEFFLEQKKSFSFKKWSGRLGGDLCISGNLYFNNEKHILFINADAMGKSMQGAGGAIVMGTVVNSMINRIKGEGDTPSFWLLEAYEELQRIFLTFEGSMGISCIIGAINERTGETVYFNAEHPRAIVYRDGKAFFVEEEVLLRKIGFPSENPFRTQKFQLFPGDVLIVGSDGRDDIRLVSGENIGHMNENMDLILELTEKSNADLNVLTRKIREQGAITDDLSLIRIGFHESKKQSSQTDAPTYIESKSADGAGSEKNLLEEIGADIRQKNHALALQKLTELNEEGNPSILYMKALCLAQLKGAGEAIHCLEEAIGLARTEKLGKKDRARLYTLLGKLYFAENNPDKSLKAFEIAYKLNPEHLKNRKALDFLHKKKKS